MSKLYQVKEEDVAVLESELPQLMESSLLACNDPMTRKRWEMVKEIISNVRWNYGPPSEAYRHDVAPEQP